MRNAPGSSWTLWPQPDTDVFGDETYSTNFLIKVDLPIILVLLFVFFLPPVWSWTGCDPFIITAGFMVHLFVFAFVVAVGYRRVPPAPRELMTHAANLIATISIPLSTSRPMLVLWVLYFLVVMLDAFGNPKSAASFVLSVAAPALSALWHMGGHEAGEKATLAGLAAAMGGVIYLVTAHLAEWTRHAAQAKAERARIKGTLEERERIGRTLDSTLGSALSEIALWHEVALAGGAARTQADPLARAQARARAALIELRELVAGIDGQPATVAGLAVEIRRHAGNLCEAAGVMFDLTVDKETPIKQGEAYNMAKIAIEGVTNAVRHGHPRRVTVELSASPLNITIEDDGAGFDPDNAPLGRGLGLLSEHAEALGAELRVDSAPGKGTRLRVRPRS